MEITEPAQVYLWLRKREVVWPKTSKVLTRVTILFCAMSFFRDFVSRHVWGMYLRQNPHVLLQFFLILFFQRREGYFWQYSSVHLPKVVKISRQLDSRTREERVRSLKISKHNKVTWWIPRTPFPVELPWTRFILGECGIREWGYCELRFNRSKKNEFYQYS